MSIITRIGDFLARRSSGFSSAEEYDRAKQAALEGVLGKMHAYVGHAIIPYAIGGPVDMYYFPQSDGGTALATMELLGYDGSAPANRTLARMSWWHLPAIELPLQRATPPLKRSS